MTAREFCRTPSMRVHGASPFAPGDLSATRAAAATRPGARVLTSKGERMRRRLARTARWPVRSSGYRNDSLIVPRAAAGHGHDELIDGGEAGIQEPSAALAALDVAASQVISQGPSVRMLVLDVTDPPNPRSPVRLKDRQLQRAAASTSN